MMWSDLKAVMDWFRGEQEPAVRDTDSGVASLMRLVAANTMANIRKAQEETDNLPYQSDNPESYTPTEAFILDADSAANPDQKENNDGPYTEPASAQGDEQEPPQEA